jgi:hypothetical protein
MTTTEILLQKKKLPLMDTFRPTTNISLNKTQWSKQKNYLLQLGHTGPRIIITRVG